MAVISIPNTAQEQPSQNQSMDNAGATGMQRAFKDTYAHLKAVADALSVGDTLDGDVFKSYALARCPGDLGVLTLCLVPDDETTSDGTTVQNALRETWTLKSVRNDMSLLSYCGPSEGSNPQRVHVELWLKETNAEIADADKYRAKDTDTTGTDLTNADKALVAKYRKGYESVMRFYPLLTKTRIYSKIPNTVYENLARINTPTVSDSKVVEKPGNFSSIISGHSWLKCQDDLQLNSDSTYTRIESWMGVPNDERAWDADFYGATPWPMPYAYSSGNS